MQAKKLTDFIKVYDDCISAEVCQQVIDLFEEEEDKQERVEREQKPNFTQFNLTQFINSGSSTAKDTLLHDNLTKVFLNTINLYCIDLLVMDELPSQYALEELRIKKYRKGTDDQFAQHVDVGNHNSARRFIATFLYLTDHEYEGQTVFNNLGLSIDPKPGRILVFPPLWMFPHAGMPVKNKDKYIVGTYCHYL
jgi:hypothetical protein